MLNRQSDITLNSGTNTFYNLKFHALQSSGKWCYILKNILLTSKLYLDKVAKILLGC